MNYRNRDLLKLAYQIPCTLRIHGVCQGGLGEPAHSNQSRHGKGKSIKADDVFFASSCRACHREIDQGSKLSREDRFNYWQTGFERTLLTMWENGLIQVRYRGLQDVVPPGTIEYGPPNDPRYRVRRRKSRCTASSKTVPRPGA